MISLVRAFSALIAILYSTRKIAQAQAASTVYLQNLHSIGDDLEASGSVKEKIGSSVDLVHSYLGNGGMIMAIACDINCTTGNCSHVQVYENRKGGTEWVPRGSPLFPKDNNGNRISHLRGFGNVFEISNDGNVAVVAASPARSDGGDKITATANVFVWDSSSSDNAVPDWRFVRSFQSDASWSRGISISVSGDGMVIAYSSLETDVFKGKVDVLKFDDDLRTSLSIVDVLKGVDKNERYGMNIDLSNDGSSIVISAPWYQKLKGKGRVEIRAFNTSTGEYALRGDYILGENYGGLIGRTFRSITISGDGNTVAIGNAYDDTPGTPLPQAIEAVIARAYRYKNDEWTPGLTIPGSMMGGHTESMFSLSDDGSLILVESSGYLSNNVKIDVYLFEDDATLKPSLVHTFGGTQDHFLKKRGLSTDLNGQENTFGTVHYSLLDLEENIDNLNVFALPDAPTLPHRIRLGETRDQLAFLENSVDAFFNATSGTYDMVFSLRIADRDIDSLVAQIKVHEHDTCGEKNFDPDAISASAMVKDKIIEQTNNMYAIVPISVLINTTNIVQYDDDPEYPDFFTMNDDNTATIKFCVKPELGHIDGVYKDGAPVTSSMFYTKINFVIKLDMEARLGIENTKGAVMEDSTKESEVANDIDWYNLTACECDGGNKECTTVASRSNRQNSMVSICITAPDTNDAVIASIQTMEFFQADNQLTAIIINDGICNSLTTAVDGYGTNKAVVSNRLTSAFFANLLDDEESSIEVSGTVLLEFGSSGSSSRKLVRFGSREEDKKKKVETGLGGFRMHFGIVSGKAESSSASDIFAAIKTHAIIVVAIGVVRILAVV